MLPYFPILLLTVFSVNFVSGLKCQCTPTGKNGDCRCTTEKGVCAIEVKGGQTIQSCQSSDFTGINLVGCVKRQAPIGSANESTTCTCTKDFCNDKLGPMDFGKRPNPIIKCKCSAGTEGCDSSGTCSTTGICYSETGGIGGYKQTTKKCVKQYGQLGCIRLDDETLEASQCGCEDKDFCNGGNANYFSFLSVFILFVPFLFNQF